jgi:hypothetical protein
MGVGYVIRHLLKLDGTLTDNDLCLRAIVKENWAPQNKAISALLGEDLERRSYVL